MDRNNLKLVIAIARTHSVLFGKIEKSLKNHNMSISEFGVLEFLYHKGRQPVQQVAEKILVTSGTITYVLDKLTEKGLVYREKCPQDKRKFYVDLTEDGKSLIREIFPQHEIFLEKLFNKVDQKTKEEMIESLFSLKESIEDIE
ncbi:MarR family winged helix-turn-helix transcriptional regulator [Gudongella sp. DL1XJH-153]|uniref:MarR family winged helix-turn-helix transcriptional regulator n=1 Tax=Gudongella sp. DL1XJH-153 TaxID=3409804 RepID=UPI003BB4952B